MSFFTDINVMYLIVIDGIIGLILIRDKNIIKIINLVIEK